MAHSKILFTHSYFLALDPKQEQCHKPYPPLMTLLAAAILRESGYPVALFDTMFEANGEKIVSALDRERPDTLVIFDDGFNYLTKMCLTNMREAAWQIAQAARARDCRVIVCSSDATDHYASYLENGADYILLGEGEMSLRELVLTLDAGGNPAAVQGIAYRDTNGKIVRTPPRAVMKDLDALPMPAWDLLDISGYRQRWVDHWGYFSINQATTRGCPFKCNWCAKPIYGDSYQMRSPQKVVEEIMYVRSLFDFDHIWFCDDIFGLKRSWVIEFADLVKHKNLQLQYKIQTRADLLVKEKYVTALADSGCIEAWMGVESGSQNILDAMEKGTTVEQIREASQLMRQHRINPCFFIQFGYLNETAADIRKTIDLITELLPHDIGISVSYPLPGTKFYDMVKADLREKANWTDSDDLDLMFQNTYTPAFYKTLHRYVHQHFRMHQAKRQWRELWRRPANLTPARLKRAASLAYYAPARQLTRRQLQRIDHEAAARI